MGLREKASLKQENFKKCCGMIVYPKGSPKIAFEGKHVYMYERAPNPKTKVWAVFNYCNDFLGEIRWKATWRQYALKIVRDSIPEDGELWFGGSCFREIYDFCDKATQEIKNLQTLKVKTNVEYAEAEENPK